MLCKLLGHRPISRSFVTKDHATFIVTRCTRCSFVRTNVVPAPIPLVIPSQLDKVRDFMRAAEQHMPDAPLLPTGHVRELRVRLIAEELLELAKASDIYFRYATEDSFEYSHTTPTEPSIIDAADAFADLLYVVLGGAIAWGIDLNKVFEEVHRSNMTKFIDGHKRSDGKWQKGPAYRPADIASIVGAQLD